MQKVRNNQTKKPIKVETNSADIAMYIQRLEDERLPNNLMK